MNQSIASLRPSFTAVTMAAAACITIVLTLAPAFADDIGSNKSELIRRLLPTVVNIAVRKDEPASPAAIADAAAPTSPTNPIMPASPTNSDSSIKSYVGSGFVIDPSGLIVTNYHVVEDAFEVTVTFADGTRLPGKTLSASRLADLAIVQVDAKSALPAAHWGNSDKLQVGDQVFAAGNPFGVGLSVSAGIVSGLNRDIQNSPYDDLIQTDATINHGNSGGPLFDMQGNVVGVNSTILSPTSGSSGIGFAIPSQSARFVVEQLRTYGWVRPGWIGVKLQTVTREIADAIGAPRVEGSIVSWVLPNGPGNKAGLVLGDVILRYDGTTPSDDRALLRDIAHTPPGEIIALVVRRNGKECNIPVTAEAWPRNQWEARDAPTLVQRPKITVPPDLGLVLAPLSADDKARLATLTGLNGVQVTGVAANSDAERRGIATGDIILRVRGTSVATPDDVRSNISAAHADKRDYILMLILPKKSDTPGPKWVALQLDATGG